MCLQTFSPHVTPPSSSVLGRCRTCRLARSVTTEMFVGGAELLPGQAFAGLVLGGTRAPSGIVAGDRVQVLAPSQDDDVVRLISPDAQVASAKYDGQTLVIRLLLDVTSAQEVQVLSGEVVIIEVDNTGPAGWELGGEEDGDS